jgi:hypothetical protein
MSLLIHILSPLQLREWLLRNYEPGPFLDEVNVCLDLTISAAYSVSVGSSSGDSESQKFWTKKMSVLIRLYSKVIPDLKVALVATARAR